ncbi:biotin-dependent carboxyltransferase family protein [Nocardioides sp.]|uniref:5-oxoprolinase subunit C family protein n=1 Tax=Nocardioides sp. TaxID=35761 RepID=UPI003516A056
MRGLEVHEAIGQVTVQDAGRRGHAHLGVPRAGWLDDPAARAALRAVGEPEGGALLEVLGTLEVGLLGPARWAVVTGAPGPLVCGGRPRAHGVPFRWEPGARVRVGRPVRGVRRYLAVGGGLEVPSVLGSRATDTLGGLGPAPLRAGDVVPLGVPVAPPRFADVVAPAAVAGRAGPVGLTVGPRLDWCAPDTLGVLTGSVWRVQPDSDRVAVRLDGPPLTRVRTEELPSEGLVPGAVQVPPGGRPVVFLADHPTTGGYPVVAVVDAEDLALLAQVAPGDAVRFTASRRS